MPIDHQHAWAVILAGGDGSRLKPLTRIISGDARPKQFCPLIGGRTLLADTRSRIESLIAPERTVFSVRKLHDRFWKQDLSGVPHARILAQPSNRGTAVGIAGAVMHILAIDPDAVISFLPADHHYDNDLRFLETLEASFQAVSLHPASLVLLGAAPYYAEPEYGWIQPVEAAELSQVARFHEKPTQENAQLLFENGYLWNTFVMTGRASTFLELLESCTPHLPATFRPILRYGLETRRARQLYSVIDPVDFSSEVLARSTARLKVLRLSGVRWSDLGKPDRVLATLAEAGIHPHWATQVQKATA